MRNFMYLCSILERAEESVKPRMLFNKKVLFSIIFGIQTWPSETALEMNDNDICIDANSVCTDEVRLYSFRCGVIVLSNAKVSQDLNTG